MKQNACYYLAGGKNTVQILQQLQSSYPKSKDLQRALGEENERITRRAYRAIQSGDAEELGRLMAEAQQNFDQLIAPHSPNELTSPLLHRVLNFDGIDEHVWGAKVSEVNKEMVRPNLLLGALPIGMLQWQR